MYRRFSSCFLCRGPKKPVTWHFKEACKDAGVKVYRQVTVEGFYGSTQPTAYLYIEEGFRFMEHLENDGKILHLERPGGVWQKKFLDTPSARYHVKYAYQPTGFGHQEPVGWKLYKLESQVIDSQTGEVLGRETNFKRIFPTHEALLAALLGPPIKWCPSPYPLPNINVRPYIPPPTLDRSVLKPITQQPEH